MAHSTTSTSSFILHKYSKSYPKLGSTQSQLVPDNSDWQHFTNPTIRLVLDIRKLTSNGELESVSRNTNELVLEDLDLLAFSAIPLRQTQKNFAQGLPLKAVHRDAVVGMRYLHPLDSSAAPSYRRFQMTFQTPENANHFIDSIQSVCPCKANPISATPMRQTPMLPPSQMHSLARNSTQVPQKRAYNESSMFNSPSIRQDPPLSDLSIQMEDDHERSRRWSTQPMWITPPQAESRMDHFAMPSLSFNPPTQSSAAEPTQPSKAPSTVASQPPAPVEVMSEEDMIAEIQQATGLYSMDRGALEKAVGDIVREDGFGTLMETLSTMWRIKALV